MKNKKIFLIIGGVVLLAVVATVTFFAVNYYLENRKVDNKIEVTDDMRAFIDGSRYYEVVSEDITVKSDVVYGSATNVDGVVQDLKLDVYSLTNDTKTNRPAILFMHGGSFTSGDKSTDEVINNLAKDFAKRGYVTFCVNYRLGKETNMSSIEDAVKDVATAFRWVQDNSSVYGVDKQKIALGGYSAGAVICIELAYSNLAKYDIDRDCVLGVVELSGYHLQQGAAKEGNPACLIVHGTADKTNPYSESEKLQKQLNKGNVRSTRYAIDGLGHDIKTRYNDIRNQIAMFLYRELTGEEVVVNTVEKSSEYIKSEERMANGISYDVKHLDVTLDGKLDEWGGVEKLTLNKLKDAGTSMPSADDFSGNAMVAWNKNTPGCVYIAAEITDDIIQNENAPDKKWYNDDCLEIIFDLSDNMIAEQLTKWVVGADGKELSVLADKENTKVAVSKNGNTSTYEICIDLSKIDKNVLQSDSAFSITAGKTIGFSIGYNDCENHVREHQIGWTAGKSSDRSKFGNLIFAAP